MKNKFNIGDKVVVDCPQATQTAGTNEGVVKELLYGCYYVQLNSVCWVIKENDMEHKIMKTPAQEVGLEVGDKIVYTGNSANEINRNKHYLLNIGDVLTLIEDDNSVNPDFRNQEGVEACFSVAGTHSREWHKVFAADSAYPSPPHKHADLIIEWARGAEIEYKSDNDWYADKAKNWYDSVEYRIKPTKSQAELDKEASIAKMEQSIKDMQTELTKIKGE